MGREHFWRAEPGVTPQRVKDFVRPAAYGWWGWFRSTFFGSANSTRTISSLIASSGRPRFSSLVVTAMRRWPDTLRCFRTPRLLGAVDGIRSSGRVQLAHVRPVRRAQEIVQASLGYFILPLVSVVLGLVIFRERLRPMQFAAIAFAGAGVASLTWDAGVVPVLALAIALSFSVYGMIRKKVPVDGLVGVTVETIVLTPIALGYLVFIYCERGGTEDVKTMSKLSVSGIVTAIPLLCFGQAARRLPLAMLGFMQYIAPSIQFLLAMWLFNEKIQGRWFNYILVWIALVVFSIDSYLWYRQREIPAAE